MSHTDLIRRLRGYLGNGGLFNPELMDHDQVRDLIIDAADALEAAEAREKALEAICEHLQAAFRINMVRAFPERSHAEIEAEIARVVREAK